MKKKIVTFIRGVKERAMMLCVVMVLSCMQLLFAQNAGAGVGAIKQVTTEIAKYIPEVQSLLYVIAAIVGLGVVVTIFVKMNNEENDIKKTIMLVIGSCVTLIALAEAVPMFFGY